MNDTRTIEQDKEVDALVARKKALEIKLVEKKNAVGTAGWKTKCRTPNFNLQILKLPQLIEFTSQLARLKSDWIAGAEILGLSQVEMAKNPPMLEGEPIEDWIADAILRRKKIEVTALEKKVEALNSALESVKSEVQKRQDNIKRVQSLLDDE